MKKILIGLILGAVLLSGTHFAHAATNSNRTVTVFFNEACNSCGELVNETYPKLFGEYGYTVTKKDYINKRENRKTLTEFNTAWKVPFELQSHIETFVDDKLLLGGHVPEKIIRYLLENPDAYDKLLVFQDKMHGDETEYRAWDFAGEIKQILKEWRSIN